MQVEAKMALPSKKKLGKRPMTDDQLRDYYAKQPKATLYDSDCEDDTFPNCENDASVTTQHLYPARGTAVGPVAAEDEHARDVLEALNQAPLTPEAMLVTGFVSIPLSANETDDECVERNIIAVQLAGETAAEAL